MDCSPLGSSVHGILQARILQGIANPCSSGSFSPSDGTQVSCIAGGFFTVWATREAHCIPKHYELVTFLKVKVTQSCLTLSDPMDGSPPGSSVHRDFPGKNTGVGTCSFLQRIVPTKGSNPGCPHCRQILYNLSDQRTKSKNAIYLGAVLAGWEHAWWKTEDPFDLLICVLLMSVHMSSCLCNQVYL